MVFTKLPKESMALKNPSEWSGWDLNSGQLSLEPVFFSILIKSCHLSRLYSSTSGQVLHQGIWKRGEKTFSKCSCACFYNYCFRSSHPSILPIPHSSHHHMLWTWESCPVDTGVFLSFLPESAGPIALWL